MSKYQIIKKYEQTLVIVQDILGDGVTSNLQLDRLGFTTFEGDYLGTFSSNQFPKYIRNEKCLILNTDPSTKKGSHWVAFYKINNKLYYYDSFNRSKSELSKYWSKRRLYKANKTDRDQSFEEKSCGSRAFTWLVLMKKYGEKAIDVI